MYIGILLKWTNSEKFDVKRFQESLKKMDAATNRVTKLVKTMRVQSRKAKPDEKKYFNFMNMIDEIEETFKLKSKTKHVGYELMNFIEDDNLEIFGDEVQIGQVLINLVNNAIDAASEHKDQWVKIKIDNDIENTVTIHVVDSGNGIPKHIQDKMFDSFFTTKGVGEGTGLGMGITREIIHGHKGELIIVEDEPNTTFRVTLPVREVIQEGLIEFDENKEEDSELNDEE